MGHVPEIKNVNVNVTAFQSLQFTCLFVVMHRNSDDVSLYSRPWRPFAACHLKVVSRLMHNITQYRVARRNVANDHCTAIVLSDRAS